MKDSRNTRWSLPRTVRYGRIEIYIFIPGSMETPDERTAPLQGPLAVAAFRLHGQGSLYNL